MKIDITDHVSKCVQCAQHKGMVPKPAPILQYPPPAGPWDVVAIDLLQLPASNQGSRYLLVCVDNFSRFVILAPLQNKTAEAVAHKYYYLCLSHLHIYIEPVNICIIIQ